MRNDKEMKEFVFDLLNSKLPGHYYYHNIEHTQYVFDKVAEIANCENCTEKQIELLQVAALWHDTGFIHFYKGHEEESCQLAKKYLPQFGYGSEDIEMICGMIMATKIPQSPKNKLEEILADADLEYLGTPLAERRAGDLFKELQHDNPQLTEKQWNKDQIAFLQQHHYFTDHCLEFTSRNKQHYLYTLIKRDV